MSDQEMGKKEIERSDLCYFADAYKWVTNEGLEYVASTECPDFICDRDNGEKVGVEITRIMTDPESAQWDQILNHKYEQSPEDTLDIIFSSLEDKEKKRVKNYGEWANKTILVLQLFDCPLISLVSLINDDLKEDFADHGFIEVWLADYTGIEAYGDVELFGLFPSKWWGHHQRKNHNKKPYG